MNEFSDLEMIVRMLPVSSRSPLNPLPLDIQLSTQCCQAAPALNVASTVNLLEGNRRTFSSKSLPETSSPSSLGLHFLLPKKVTRFEAHSFRDEVLEFVYLSPSSNCDFSSPPSFPLSPPLFTTLLSDSTLLKMPLFDYLRCRSTSTPSPSIENQQQQSIPSFTVSPLSLSFIDSYSHTISSNSSTSRIMINQSPSQSRSRRFPPLDLSQLFVESLPSSPLRDLDISPISRLAQDPNLP